MRWEELLLMALSCCSKLWSLPKVLSCRGFAISEPRERWKESMSCPLPHASPPYISFCLRAHKLDIYLSYVFFLSPKPLFHWRQQRRERRNITLKKASRWFQPAAVLASYRSPGVTNVPPQRFTPLPWMFLLCTFCTVSYPFFRKPSPRFRSNKNTWNVQRRLIYFAGL